MFENAIRNIAKTTRAEDKKNGAGGPTVRADTRQGTFLATPKVSDFRGALTIVSTAADGAVKRQRLPMYLASCSPGRRRPRMRS